MDLSEQIKKKAIELGFDLVGITTAEPIDAEQIEAFNEWLGRGYSADLSYMKGAGEKRFSPVELLAGARSVIVAAIGYKPSQQELVSRERGSGKVATYAQYEDYHIFIEKLLQKLKDFIASIADALPLSSLPLSLFSFSEPLLLFQ